MWKNSEDNNVTTVCVMMSTYNGAHYLQEQIDSIEGQYNVNCKLIIRDDGSQDNTINLIKENCRRYDNIKLISGSNLGSASSFMELLHESPECDYYAFSDQDDIWDLDKLWVAIQQLSNTDECALYYCDYREIDKDGNILSSNDREKLKKLSIYELALTNNCSGCTMVFNKKLRDIIVQNKPTRMLMHDHYIYFLSVALGASIFCDSQAHISYRQHQNNVIGARIPFWKKVKLSSFGINKRIRSDCAIEVYNFYEKQLTEESKELLKKIKKHKKRELIKIFSPFEKSLKRKVILAVNVILGVY